MLFMANILKPGSRLNLAFGYVSNLKECFLGFAFVVLPYADVVGVLGSDTGRHACTATATQVSFCDVFSGSVGLYGAAFSSP